MALALLPEPPRVPAVVAGTFDDEPPVVVSGTVDAEELRIPLQ
jgi:hypothetical protein